MPWSREIETQSLLQRNLLWTKCTCYIVQSLFSLVFSYIVSPQFILVRTRAIYPPSVLRTFNFRKQAEVFIRGPGYDSYSLSLPGNVDGIATRYGLDGPGIESQWGRDFPHQSRPALTPTQPPVQWVSGLSQGVRYGRGVTLTPQPLVVKVKVNFFRNRPRWPKGFRVD